MRKLASVLIALAAVLATAAATPMTARRGAFGLDAFPDAFAACGGKRTALFQACRPQSEVLARATAGSSNRTGSPVDACRASSTPASSKHSRIAATQ